MTNKRIARKEEHQRVQDDLSRQVAELYLETPTIRQFQAANQLRVSESRIGTTVRRAGGLENLLLKYGGEAATPEKIEMAVSSFEARRRVPVNVPRRTISYALKPLPVELCSAHIEEMTSRRPPIAPVDAAHCHWVVDSDADDPFCRKEVSGLYCKEHDVLAKSQERALFMGSGPKR